MHASYASYGYSTQFQSVDSTYYGLGMVLVHQINPALVGNITYRLNVQDNGQSSTGQLQNGQAVQNVISVGLRQSF